MQCYFLRNGRLAGVEMLPPGFSDRDAIARALILSSKRKGPLDVGSGPRGLQAS
jgi:hypothetical protein